MASNRWSNRDPRTGRWSKVDVSNTPLAADSKFPTFSKEGFEVGSPSDVKDSPYELVPGDRNVVQRPVAPRVQDDLGGSPLRSRNPKLVPDNEQSETLYGRHGQGQVGRVAAARGERHRIPGTDVEQDPSRRLTGSGE